VIADQLVWEKIVQLMSSPDLMRRQAQRWIESRRSKGAGIGVSSASVAHREVQMRKWLLVIVALATPMFLADAASAGHVSIGGTHSANEIRGTCSSVGGQFIEGGGIYGCQKDCGADVCSVTCVGGKCTGNCPKCGRRERECQLPTLGGDDAADRILKDSVERPSKR